MNNESSHNHIFPSSNVSSSRPTKFVPGNRFWIERRMSQKYRRQDEQKKTNEENDKYFTKVTTENQLFKNWEKNHPMVRHDQPYNQDHLTMNFMDLNIKDQVDQEIRQECIEKLTKLLQTYDQSRKEYSSESTDSLTALKFLFDFKELHSSINERRQKDLIAIKSNLYDIPYNGSRDPLRRVCFIIKGLLTFYKDSIFSLIKLFQKLNKFLRETEQAEISKLNNRCFQIMDMYLQMNDLRNEHFFRMYSEEKENVWKEQKSVWRSEIDIWDNLMVKLLKSNYDIVFKKVHTNLETQQKLLDTRMTNFDTLLKDFIETQNNAFLRPILEKDIGYFKI